MITPKELEINGRKYSVTPMNPMRMLHFVHGYREALMKKQGVSEFHEIALKQCADTMLRPLAKDENFAACFGEFPEDMFPLAEAALDALTLPFMPPPEATGKGAKGSSKALRG